MHIAWGRVNFGQFLRSFLVELTPKKDIFSNKLTFKVGLKHRDRGESVYEAERVYGPQYQSATYESILEIDNVRTEHYTTTFRCEAVNKFGAASNDMQV